LQNNTFFGDLLRRHIIVLNRATSTNDYLKQLLANFTPLPEYTAIMAKAQTEGRGQRGTKWLSLPQQNLTVSFYLKPHDLPLSKQFFLTVIGSLAVRDTLKR
jgi:BirA family biotin operon repressor/biotin-[acetyl-CoA-carboxylase] ligase